MIGSGPHPADLLVVGGGINGAGIARDAAGRGLSVVLCEQGDLAGATSSASTKLIHGGLRYLEHYEFRLVREALIEREVLLAAAPHIVRPLRFVLPHDRSMRPAWLLRLGLFLYDHLGGLQTLPGSRALDLRRHEAGRPLDPRFRRAFEYSDCWVEDSRLVVLNAADAAARGARILTRTRLIGAERKDGLWRARLQPVEGGAEIEVRARAVVNAAGPWVAEVLKARLGLAGRHAVRLVKGSHIVVPRLFEGTHAYIFQNDDRRIVFAIPYEGDYTLIGTTDVELTGEPGTKVEISQDEISYLCRAVSRYFAQPVRPDQVVWSYSGVRPLQDDAGGDASAVTRDYVLELDGGEAAGGARQAPLLSVFGGKITTFRRLAEHALDLLAEPLGRAGVACGRPWTANARLPGGDIPRGDVAGFRSALLQAHPWLPPALAARYVRTYGSATHTLIAGARRLADLGRNLGAGVFEAELDYGVAHEFVREAQDFLWRRTKLGLHLDQPAREAVAHWYGRTAGRQPDQASALQPQSLLRSGS